MRHSQFFQVVDTGCQLVRIYRTRFRHCKELAFVPNARRGVYGEVTVVYLVDYHIGRRCQRRTFIFRPAFRVGFPHIDNSRTLTVYTYSLRIDTRRIAQPFSVDFYIESIELAFQILLHLSRPRTVFGGFADASACGNETASDRPMMRKYMVESVLHWINEYHIDGFLFDLMGIHDIETMNEIRKAATAVDPTIFIYG